MASEKHKLGVRALAIAPRDVQFEMVGALNVVVSSQPSNCRSDDQRTAVAAALKRAYR